MNITTLLPVLISSAGIYLFVSLRAFFVVHPIRTARLFATSLRDRTSRRALLLALAGTLGVGNIFGVAVGLIIGGAGSLFWLLISALFSSVIKYSEAALSVSAGGGMIELIKAKMGTLGKPLSKIYAALCLALALAMGAGVQADSLTECAAESFGVSPLPAAALFSLLVIILTRGGAEKISNATEILIPLTTIVYIFMTSTVIFINAEKLPTVIFCVISSAFSPLAAGGGIAAFLFSNAMREGFARGILSNEAGAGTSTMAHSRSSATPTAAGLFGMCEVFFDTVVLCPLTALAILTAIPDTSRYTSAMSLVSDAIVGTLGAPFAPVLFFCILSFATATVICWYYYGDVCRGFLFAERFKPLYAIAFHFFIFVGALSEGFLTVRITDAVLLPMTVITLATLISSARSLRHITRLPEKRQKISRNH